MASAGSARVALIYQRPLMRIALARISELEGGEWGEPAKACAGRTAPEEVAAGNGDAVQRLNAARRGKVQGGRLQRLVGNELRNQQPCNPNLRPRRL